MAKYTIDRGTTANDGTGDNLRAGANKVNLNFDEIYLAIGDGTTLAANIKVKDDSSTVATINAKGETLGVLGGTGIASTISGSDVTLAIDATVVTAASTTTLTNKTISGASNTLTNIPNSSLDSIANSALTSSTITVSDGSATDAVSLGETVTIAGTANEVETAVTANTVTLGLPNDVTISNDLTVLGDLDVQGTQTVIDSATIQITNSFTFEGTTSDDNETVLTVIDPTADRTVSLPDATGTIVLKDTTDTLTNKTLTAPTINGVVGGTATSQTITALTTEGIQNATGNLEVTPASAILEIQGDGSSVDAQLLLNCHANTHGQTLKSQPHGDSVTNTMLLPKGANSTLVSLVSTDTLTNKTLDLTTAGNKVRANFAGTGAFPDETTYEGMFAYDTTGDAPYVADTSGWAKIITENMSIGAISDVNLSGIAANYGLIWSTAQGRFNVQTIPTAGFSIAMAVAL